MLFIAPINNYYTNLIYWDEDKKSNLIRWSLPNNPLIEWCFWSFAHSYTSSLVTNKK